MSKLELYWKNNFRFIPLALQNESYGVIGSETDITYKDGSIALVGDIVVIRHTGETEESWEKPLVYNEGQYGVMGMMNNHFRKGLSINRKGWSIEKKQDAKEMTLDYELELPVGVLWVREVPEG